MVQGGGVNGKGQRSHAALPVGQGIVNNAGNLFGSQGLEGKDPAPGKQRGVHLERGIFRSGPDKNDGAILDMGQNHILLGFVETVDFVNEQDGAPLVHSLAVFGLGRYPAQVGYAGSDGADRLEVGLRYAGYQPGQSSLAAARRPPQD